MLSFRYIHSLASTFEQNHAPSTRAPKLKQRLDTNQSNFLFFLDTLLDGIPQPLELVSDRVMAAEVEVKAVCTTPKAWPNKSLPHTTVHPLSPPLFLNGREYEERGARSQKEPASLKELPTYWKHPF